MKFETIYKATKGGKTQEWTIEVVGNKYRTISGQTDGKKITNEWTIVYGKNTGKLNETTDKEQTMKEAIAKRIKKLESGYFEDMKNIYTEQYFEPMLASKWEDSKDKITYPIYSQPKLDGIRCIVTSEGMFSRNGKAIISAPHIREGLQPLFDENPDLIFDGELYADKFANDFNKIVSLVKKTKPTDADLKESKKNIEYHIYDLPSAGGTFENRFFNNLIKMYDTLPKYCVLVKTMVCRNENEVNILYEDCVEAGYEGQILRLNKEYENKRSKFLLKHKSFIDEEYTIVDVCEGEGNKTNMVGYMTFETADGKPFKSNVKATFEESEEMFRNRKQLIGKQATIKYFNLTPDGIPRFGYVINIDRASYE